MYIMNPKLDRAGQTPTPERPIHVREIFLRLTLAVGMLLAMAHPLQAQDELGFGSSSPDDGVVQTQIEEQIEEQVEEQVIEQTEELGFGHSASLIESQIEENIEEQVEVDVEENVAENIETSIADTLEERIEDQAAEEIDDEVAQNVEDKVEDIVTEAVEEDITTSAETNLENVIEDSVSGTVENQLDGEIDDIIEGVESEFEISEDRIHKNQWLVMAERSVFTELQEEGYLFDNITELPGMGVWLADVAAPSSFNITEARQGVIDVVGSNRAEVDLNHIYAAGATVASAGPGIAPRSALRFPDDTQEMSLRIGMIDSEVDLSHPVFAASRIQTRSFVPESAEKPNFHGTAIASIIAANNTDYVGLAPHTELFAASVFEKDPKQGEIASTLNLIKALDWLISSGVDVINISLAGPPNRLLESALDRVAQRGTLIVAAAGNGGPSSEPMYPAAYSAVVAVTAVDATGRVFRLANRGKYLDLAAPGVDLLHARAGGGYTSSSGTSFAVPFAATAAARLVKLHPGDDVMASLYASAEDRGPLGRDDIYGYGLLHLTSR
jgi:subtilisin family serine protease